MPDEPVRVRVRMKRAGEASFSADELISALMDINQPDAQVITEVDLNGDVRIGQNVRRVSYDGFHHTITISGSLERQHPLQAPDEDGPG